jgi:TatD DNase family protein
MYIDTHAHLTDKRYKEPDTIIGDFEKDGIDFVVNVAYDGDTTVKSAALAAAHERVFASAGIHPFDASHAPESLLKTVEETIVKPKVVAVGEIGLDYHYDNVVKERQKFFFAEQMKIAHKHNKPVIIHSRDATGDMTAILKEHRALLRRGGVMHSFSGSVETMREYLGLGFYISFSGTVTYNNTLSAALTACPLDRILFETDCPYLTPEPRRRELNYPSYVKYVYEYAAQKLGVRIETLCKTVRENVRSLFGI